MIRQEFNPCQPRTAVEFSMSRMRNKNQSRAGQKDTVVAVVPLCGCVVVGGKVLEYLLLVLTSN